MRYSDYEQRQMDIKSDLSVAGHGRDRRRPTSAELGLDVTIAIVALTYDGHVVAVSDRMISHDDVFQADDAAALKTIPIAGNWFAAFAGDPGAFRVVARKLTRRLRDIEFDGLELRKLAAECYQEAVWEEFAVRHLVQLGYKTVEEFRKSGRNDLGESHFNKLTLDLLKADLSLEMIVFSVEPKMLPGTRLFEVVNPGRIVERVTGYTAVGSGYCMAMSALRRKSLDPRDLDTVIYRLLDAKFSAETASGVGKSTTVIWMGIDGKVRRIDTEEVDRIRKIWDEVMKQPDPPDAINIIRTYTSQS